MLDVHQIGHPLQRFVKEGVVDIDLAALVARPLPAAYDGRLDALGERPRHAPLIDASVAVEIFGHGARHFQRIVPRPVARRIGDAGRIKEVEIDMHAGRAVQLLGRLYSTPS